MDYLIFLRQFKIGPFAIFDLVVSYLGIFLIAPLLTKLFSIFKLSIPLNSWLWLTLPISILFHLIFAPNTPLMKVVTNPSHLSFYIAITVLLLMTYMGWKDIKWLS